MLKIRLQRGGKKGQPHFRVVLQEHTEPVKREAQEILGTYSPASNPKVFKVDQERVKYWLSKGATISDSLAVLLKKDGLEGMEKFIEPRKKQRKKKGEQQTPQQTPQVSTPTLPAPAAPAKVPKALETPTPAPEAPAKAPKALGTPTPAPEAPAPVEPPKAPEAAPAPAAPAPETPAAKPEEAAVAPETPAPAPESPAKPQ